MFWPRRQIEARTEIQQDMLTTASLTSMQEVLGSGWGQVKWYGDNGSRRWDSALATQHFGYVSDSGCCLRI